MDKNAIKRYAVWARRELIDRVTQKAYQYGIKEDNIIDANTDSIGGNLLSPDEKKQRQALILHINEIAKENNQQKAFEVVMEEVAYTWFNRFTAIRFMEVNGYLPSHVRVFTDENNKFEPQIITEAIHLELDGLDKEKVYGYIEKNQKDELYKYLLITQCNSLGKVLPVMFQKIDDYTKLLIPDNLLREESVIGEMINMILDEDWKDQVQIIGWLYQYYNSEPKDQVFAALKKNVKISKENIPAATQLFTPDWIVRYMVENSLGKLWLEGHPNDKLKDKWKYYLDETEQEAEVQAQLDKIREEYKNIKPEEIRVIDPCMGSGHILVYTFDVLMQIYESYGYNQREAANSIVENNLYGLDIDERAAQLAYFAVMMKARQYDRRFFSREAQPHVYEICESNHLDQFCVDYFINGNAKLKADMQTLIDELHDAKEYGSIIHVTNVDFDAIYKRFEEIRNDINIVREVALTELLPLVSVAQVLAQKYDVAVTNPPYLSARGSMTPILTKYLAKYYPVSKNDLFTVFMDVCGKMIRPNGFYSMVNQQSWMFLAGFAKLREQLYSNYTFDTLIHIGAGAFEGIAGEVVQSVAFSLRKNCNLDYKSTFVKMTDSLWKEYLNGFNNIKHKYIMSISEIKDIPNGILCYSLGGGAIKQYYEGKRLDSFADPRVGMATGDNDLFVRLWHEVQFEKIGFGCKNGSETEGKYQKWYPYNKGGECRRWYGNRTHLVDWNNNGHNIYEFKQGRLLRGEIEKKNSECWNRDYYFMESISWSKVSSGRFAVRYYEEGFIFDVAGCSILGLGNNLYYVMGALNSELRNAYIESLSPTLNFETGAIKAFPIIVEPLYVQAIEKIVRSCISLEKADWDSFENSWDYKQHPLIELRHGYVGIDGHEQATIRDAFMEWKLDCENRFNKLKANEEELNRIFIEIYGLQDELTPCVEGKDITVSEADLQCDVKNLISYAVGCMFGRYSLDVGGLVYAGGDWDTSKYKTYPADEDNIIPICDDEYFSDDIMGRFVKFIETVYGKDTLEENLKFIAEAIGGKGMSRDVIRDYFLNVFYADHCTTYSTTGSGKRPIYWLFDSGKKNGFKALIYMHRYQPDTIARMRTDYVHEQQERYRTAIQHLEQRIFDISTAEKVKLNKQLLKLQEQSKEIKAYEEKIHHLADQMISIDLDDGVTSNYALFKDVLAKIK